MSIYALRLNHGILKDSEAWLMNQSFQELQQLRSVLYLKGGDGNMNETIQKKESFTNIEQETKKNEKESKQQIKEEEEKIKKLENEKIESNKKDVTNNKRRKRRPSKINRMCTTVGHVVTAPVRKTKQCSGAVQNRWKRKSNQKKKDKADVANALDEIINQIVKENPRENSKKEDMNMAKKASKQNSGILFRDMRLSIGSEEFFGRNIDDEDEDEDKKEKEEKFKSRTTQKKENKEVVQVQANVEELAVGTPVFVPFAERSMENVLELMLEQMKLQIRHATFEGSQKFNVKQ